MTGDLPMVQIGLTAERYNDRGIIAIANQKVGRQTTTASISRCFAERLKDSSSQFAPQEQFLYFSNL